MSTNKVDTHDGALNGSRKKSSLESVAVPDKLLRFVAPTGYRGLPSGPARD